MSGRKTTGRTPDLVVIGSGVAGLAAAVEAAEAGLDVRLLEAADTIGGASVMSGAACFLVDTPLQRSQGITDSVELAMADWQRMGGPTADLEWARRYVADSAREVYEWCAGLGIEWQSLGRPEGNSVPRWHIPAGWGRRIVEVLEARARALGVTVRTGVTAEELCRTDGRITGVRTRSAGIGETLPTGAVAVCTGGYVGRIDMVLKHSAALRELPRVLAGGSPTAVGLGHGLLEACGAEFTNLDHVWIYPTGTPDPSDRTGARGLGIRGVTTEIWLNTEGRRFHDESLRGGHSGTGALLDQPGRTAWSVFSAAEAEHVLLIDNEHYGTPAGPDPAAMKRFWTESAYVRTAADPAALARASGLPEEAVVQAIGEFDTAVRTGAVHDPLTGRAMALLTELTGELIAVQLFPMAQKNLGGVRTGPECEVLTASGEPVEGLYAAGEVAGMAGGRINGRAALEGTMFGPCLYSGRIAGRAAARRAR
ncbi:FAD-dependent oxidoreductase [Streptomyces sp. NPDC056244]|uniref:FAD-dependent oxidoreductase n=1 Tax=Streptomyces sp. NPDC056244 TaxID=3345762 RepID=UPI0035DFF560